MIPYMIKIEVNEGKLPWVVGIGTILFGILLGILVILYSKGSAARMWSVCLILVLMIGAGILLCIGGRNRRLTVEDSKISYRNWFGRQRIFTLKDIDYCDTALEKNGSKDFLRLYDHNGNKLCKLEYSMKDCVIFLQYLLDNQIEVRCSDKSDMMLRSMIRTTAVSAGQISAVVNEAYDKARELVSEWEKDNRKFEAKWKTGIATYLTEMTVKEKGLWEQEGYTPHSPDELPEGYLIAIEGYLQKDGQFVLNRQNHAVSFYTPVVCVSKSYQIEEQLKIRCFGNAMEELADMLDIWAHFLPVNRYHTGMISINHDLKDRI